MDPVTPGAWVLPVDAIQEAVDRTNALVADLAAQNLHVGVNGRCVTCGTDWPCTIGNQALAALEAGQRFIVDLDGGMSTDEALEAAVARGWMEHAGVDDDGQQLYKLTLDGVAKVESMGAGTDEQCSPPTG